LQVPLDKHGAVTVYLTPTEKEKLKDYLDTTSMDKFLVALLEAIRDKEFPIRNAASKVMSHLFANQPSLVNAKTLKLIEKNFLQGDADIWLAEGLDMLKSFVKSNPAFASAGIKLVFKIVEKQVIINRHASIKNDMSIAFFISDAVTYNPDCVATLIQMAEDDMRASQENRNEYYRYLCLFVLGAVEPLKVIEKNPKHIQAIWKICFTNYPDRSNIINFAITDLLNKIVEIDPAYSQAVFETLLHQTKKQIKRNEFNEIVPTINKLGLMVSVNAAYIPEAMPVAMQLLQSHELMSSRSMLILATIVDHKNEKYDQQVFQALIEKISATKEPNYLSRPTILLILRVLVERYPAYAKQAVDPISRWIIKTDYSHQRAPMLKTLMNIVDADPTTLSKALKVANDGLANSKDQICLNSLQLLIYLAKKEPAHYDAIFQLATDLVTDKNWEIRNHALDLVYILAEVHPGCSKQAFDIATQVFKDKEIKIRIHALSISKMLVKTYKQQYISQACEIAKQALQDKKEDVRKVNIGLLVTILQVDPSYVQNPDFRYILDQAKLDKNKDIRKSAEELLTAPSTQSK